MIRYQKKSTLSTHYKPLQDRDDGHLTHLLCLVLITNLKECNRLVSLLLPSPVSSLQNDLNLSLTSCQILVLLSRILLCYPLPTALKSIYLF